MDRLIRNDGFQGPASQVGGALRARLSVLVFVEILVNAALAEGVEALVDGVCVPEEASAEWALEKRMEVLLLDPSDQSCLSRVAQHLLL